MPSASVRHQCYRALSWPQTCSSRCCCYLVFSALLFLCLLPVTKCDGIAPQFFATSSDAVLPGSAAYPYAYYDGDILLSGLFPVRRLGPDQSTPAFDRKYTCGPIDMQDGIQVLEAMMFALDRINKKGFLNFRLGAIALDTCQNADVALEQAVHIVEYVRLDFGGTNRRRLCSNLSRDLTETDVRLSKIVGVVGAAMSDVSIALANFLKLYRIPQISYFSTSPDLSNSIQFPYFLRTVPPDKEAVHAIIELLMEFKWSYVTVVYDDTNYGSRAFYAFEEFIANPEHIDHNVCMAAHFKLEVSSNQLTTTTAAKYRKRIDDLLKVSRVKVVVLFIAQTTVDGFFSAVNTHPNQTQLKEYLWIGTDSWAGREGLKTTNPTVLARSINVMPKAYTNEDFTKYMMKRRPSSDRERNPWLKSYFEAECSAMYADHSGDVDAVEEKCAKKVFHNFKQMLYVHFVTDAIYAYAYALHKLERSVCGQQANCQLKSSSLNRTALMNILRTIQFTDISGETFKFDGIDGPPNYTILYYNSTNHSFVIGGQYRGIKNARGLTKMRLSFNEAFKLHAQQFNESRCVDECAKNQAKQFLPQNHCCWVCTDCNGAQIVKTLPNKTERWSPAILPGERRASQCDICPTGSHPDDDHQTCIPIARRAMSPQQPLAIAVIICCCLGIVICFLIAGIFLHFRHTPLIKASGRETSFFLLAGILLSYLLPLMLVQPPSLIVCGLMRVAPGLCLTVCYAAILAKTNRIARIFQLSASGALGAKKPKFISPLSQLYFCAILVAVELIILVIWVIMEPPASKVIADNISRNDLICSGRDHIDALVGLLCPIVLLILTTMYAFRVRKTPDGFNEARCLGFVNYANCVVIVTSLPIIFIFNNLIHSALTLCFPLVTSATADLLGLFLPKIYTIFRRPDKNTREAVMSRTRSQSQVSIPGATANVTAHNSANSHANLAESFALSVLPPERRANSVKVKEAHVHGAAGFQRSISGSGSLHLANPSFRSQKSVSFSEMNRVVDSCTDIRRQNSQRSSLHSRPTKDHVTMASITAI